MKQIKQREPLLVDLLTSHTRLGPGMSDLSFSNFIKEDVQIFRLSKEVAIAAAKVCNSDTFEFPDIEDFHLPYKSIVVEMPVIVEGELPEDTEKIIKVAAKIDEVDSITGQKMFNFTPFWQFQNGTMGASPTAITWGAGELFEMMKRIAAARLLAPKNPSSFIELAVTPASYLLDCAERNKTDNGQFAKQFMELLRADSRMISQATDELTVLLFGAQLILGCKAGLSHTKMPKQNPTMGEGVKYGKHKQNLLKRSGYTIVHLAESEVVDELGTISIHADIAAHYVRGHFKQRKSGIYWWSSFVRGKGEPAKREAYEVTA